IGYHTSKSVLSGDGLDYYHSSRKTDFFMHLFLDIYEFCNTLNPCGVWKLESASAKKSIFQKLGSVLKGWKNT
ncbi:hypothetical protein Q0N88_33610, partial [Bacillus thuringiensis]|uniref:hypothetical protein n=1 Tax=Bacillus thuringiensis TaxID=1428 RepID=UPI003458949E